MIQPSAPGNRQSTIASAIYGRVSTNQQSTEAQEARAKDYLKFKWGDGAVAAAIEFYDDDTSGSIPIWDRPKGRQLRARLLQGDIKHLVVAKLGTGCAASCAGRSLLGACGDQREYRRS